MLTAELVSKFLTRLDEGFARFRVRPETADGEPVTALELHQDQWAVTFGGEKGEARQPLITCSTEQDACLAFLACIADLEARWKGHNPVEQIRPWSKTELTVQKVGCIFRLCGWTERLPFQRVEPTRFGDLVFATQYDCANRSRSIRIGLNRSIWRAEEEVDARLVVIAEHASEHGACSAAVARMLEGQC